MLNVVVIMGRLVADPELRTTTNGINLARFRIACDRSYARQGEQRQTDFLDVVAWRQQADFVCKYFQKGQLMAVNGSLQTRSYEKDGVKRKVTQVVVQSAYFCESRNTSSGTQHRAPAASSVLPATSPLSQDEMEEILGADDIPF